MAKLTNLSILFGMLLSVTSLQARASLWQDLFQTQTAQAIHAFQQEQFKTAAELFKQPLWQGIAYYKAGLYQKAAYAFALEHSAIANYNHGNALAQLGQYQAAIEAYERALQKDPSLQKAVENRAQLQDWLARHPPQSDTHNQPDLTAISMPQNEPQSPSLIKTPLPPAWQQALAKIPEDTGPLLQQKFLRDYLQR